MPTVIAGGDGEAEWFGSRQDSARPPCTGEETVGREEGLNTSCLTILCIKEEENSHSADTFEVN